MSEYGLDRLNEQNIRVNASSNFFQNNSNLNIKNVIPESPKQSSFLSDSADSLGSNDGLAAGISNILNG